jgi:hypothetical protein
MAKSACGLAFATEPSQPFCIVSHLRRQNFYGDTIAKQNVARTIHCTHSTFAQHRFNVVLAVENSIDQGLLILFKDLAINRAEGDCVFVFCFAERAVFHSGLKNIATQASLRV